MDLTKDSIAQAYDDLIRDAMAARDLRVRAANNIALGRATVAQATRYLKEREAIVEVTARDALEMAGKKLTGDAAKAVVANDPSVKGAMEAVAQSEYALSLAQAEAEVARAEFHVIDIRREQLTMLSALLRDDARAMMMAP